MADKNLHDIKIDELDSPKKTPLKNILTLLALLFIILVISVVITRLILNTDNGKEIENNVSTLIPSTTEITEELNKSTEVKNTEVVPVLDNKIIERNSSSVTKDSLRTHTPAKETKTPKTYKTPKAHTTQKEPKKSTPKKEYIDKVVVKKHTPAKKQASYLGAHLKTLTNSYYIKVGSFKNTTAIISKIKKSNFNYSVKKLDNDSQLSRVYVGPFFSQNQAEKNLKKVQQSIAKSAYVQKVKP